MAEYESLLHRALGESIAVGITCDAGLWLCSVDRAQFENCILNLAFNARDAMPSGGRFTISLHNAELGETDEGPPPGDYVLVSVADTGEGIASDQIDRVFEPFFTTKEVGHGTGLGLSQVYGFVKQSGGHVRLESTVGAGTTVMIYLPKAAGLPVAPKSPAPKEENATGSETVLMVEDDPGVLDIVMTMMEELGYRVLTARNGPEALSMLEGGEPIDLLFTDLVMPQGISGGELAERAQQMRPELKILLGSGYSARGPAAASTAGSGLPILKKPYRQAELAAKLRSVLDRDIKPKRRKY
jgi:CheY-like chemotaxis protein